ncbi:uncharacterized protein LOC135212553 [Macrobrachium nipponense]|uniref:uncharacterized protein LOC135212553 n=1 Tax=Macrobrachium nipponense TaxID=159736 RepID=UPI0030C7CA33
MEPNQRQEYGNDFNNRPYSDWSDSIEEEVDNSNSENLRVEYLYLGISVLFAIALTYLIHVLENKSIDKDLKPMRKIALKKIFAFMTPLMTAVGVGCLYYEETLDLDAVISYSSPFSEDLGYMAITRTLATLTHIFFAFRALVFWTTTLNDEWFITFVNVTLFAFDVVNFATGHYFVAFHYFIVVNFFCPEIEKLISRCARFVKCESDFAHLYLEACVITILLAGTLRLGEEWRTNQNSGTPEEVLSQMESLFTYIYWIIITISSVGYGDILPTTILGQLTVMFIVIYFLTWLNDKAAEISDGCRDLYNKPFKKRSIVFVGCKDKHEMRNLKEAVSDESKISISVYSGFMVSPEEKEALGLDVIQGISAKEAIKTMHLRRKDQIIMIRGQNRILSRPDKIALDTVRSLKGRRCRASFTVEMNTFECQEFMTKIVGWEPARDACISLEFVKAHMLTLAAYSTLAPAFIKSSFMKQLIFDDREQEESYYEELNREYFYNDRLVLAAVNAESEIVFFSDRMEGTWCRIFLENEPCTVKDRSVHFRSTSQVKTSAVSSQISIAEGRNDALQQALRSHNLIEAKGKNINVMILNTRDHLDDITKRRMHEKRQVRLVSAFEHGYSKCCKDQDVCLCGTYETENLLRDLVIAAFSDRRLYDLWIKLITENYLHAEVIEKDCTYGDVFKYFTSLRRVLLAAEIRGREGVPSPVISPTKECQLREGDIVLYLQKPLQEE